MSQISARKLHTLGKLSNLARLHTYTLIYKKWDFINTIKLFELNN